MTKTEMKLATEAALWTRLEALEFQDDDRDWLELNMIRDEIVRRDDARPWSRLEQSFEDAAQDEALGWM